LGRNAPPDERERRLKEKSVGAYVQRGRGGIFFAGTERHGTNPLELALRASAGMPELFRPWLAKLRTLPVEHIESIINAVPDALMDATAKRFSIASVEFSYTQLCKL
jgi:hypothetical protein